MTPDQFCYWLQGLLELMPDLKTFNEEQVAMVRAHLGYVFEHGHLDSGARIKALLEELQKKPAPAVPAPSLGDLLKGAAQTPSPPFGGLPRVYC